VNLFGSGLPDQFYHFHRGGAAHDGVIDNDHPFALQDTLDRVELDLDIKIADALLGVDEGAADIVVSDQADFERYARLLGEPQRGGIRRREYL